MKSFYTDVNNLVNFILTNDFDENHVTLDSITKLDSNTDLLHLYKLFHQWQLNPLSVFAMVLVTVDDNDNILVVDFPKQVADNNYLIINQSRRSLATREDVVNNKFLILSAYQYLDSVLESGIDMLSKHSIRINKRVNTLRKLLKLLDKNNVKIGTFENTKMNVINSINLIKSTRLYLVTKRVARTLNYNELDNRRYIKVDNILVSDESEDSIDSDRTFDHKDTKEISSDYIISDDAKEIISQYGLDSNVYPIFINILSDVYSDEDVIRTQTKLNNARRVYNKLFDAYSNIEYNEDIQFYFGEKSESLRQVRKYYNKFVKRRNDYITSVADAVKRNFSNVDFGVKNKQQLVDIFGKTKSASFEIIKKALDYVPTSWIEAVSQYYRANNKIIKLVTLKETGRSFYEFDDDDSENDRLHTRLRIDDALHEFIHVVERVVKSISDSERDFYDYRTKGCPITNLPNHGKDELFRVDKFNQPYMGKDYRAMRKNANDRSFELMSVGIELLFTKPAEFSKEDSEMINWLFDVIKQNTTNKLDLFNVSVKGNKVSQLSEDESAFEIISKYYFIAVVQLIESLADKMHLVVSSVTYNEFFVDVKLSSKKISYCIKVMPDYTDLLNPIVKYSVSTSGVSEIAKTSSVKLDSFINKFYKIDSKILMKLFQDNFLRKSLLEFIYSKLDDAFLSYHSFKYSLEHLPREVKCTSDDCVIAFEYNADTLTGTDYETSCLLFICIDFKPFNISARLLLEDYYETSDNHITSMKSFDEFFYDDIFF